MGGVPPWGGGRVGHGPLRTILSARPPRAWARRHRIWCRPVPRRSARLVPCRSARPASLSTTGSPLASI